MAYSMSKKPSKSTARRRSSRSRKRSPRTRARPGVLRIGTRKSRLALAQAREVLRQLRLWYPKLEIRIVKISAEGDKVTRAKAKLASASSGRPGLFSGELERALLAGKIDCAVHSLKDLPVRLPRGLTVIAITPREDPHDALLTPSLKTLQELPPGSRIGTSSLRRSIFLKRAFPLIEILPLRGNVPSRIQRLRDGHYDGIVLSVAGLLRLGATDLLRQVIPFTMLLPAASQGALGIEIRKIDKDRAQMLRVLNHYPTAQAVRIERHVLDRLQAGCQVPLGIVARAVDGTTFKVQAAIASIDGKKMLQAEASGSMEDPDTLAKQILSSLKNQGVEEIVEEIRSVPPATLSAIPAGV